MNAIFLGFVSFILSGVLFLLFYSIEQWIKRKIGVQPGQLVKVSKTFTQPESMALVLEIGPPDHPDADFSYYCYNLTSLKNFWYYDFEIQEIKVNS